MVALDCMLLQADASGLGRLQQIFPADLVQVNVELQHLQEGATLLPYLKSVMLKQRPSVFSNDQLLSSEADVFKKISDFRIMVMGTLQDKHYEVRA